MTIIEVIMKDISSYVPVSRAKSDLLEIIRRLETEEAVAVTKNGVPAAVIISVGSKTSKARDRGPEAQQSEKRGSTASLESNIQIMAKAKNTASIEAAPKI
jgi:prevent-host-death family protein